MTLTVDLLTNQAYGFPRGGKRRVKPVALLCLHITGNSSNLGPDAAQNERNYANRPGSVGPSAHTYLDRDGTGVLAITTDYTAWSNGDLNAPNPVTAKTVLDLVAKGYNANEAYVREIECVGFPSTAPITDAQVATVVDLLRSDAKAFGLPINRQTVSAHADLNSVDRANCPVVPAQREALLSRIIALANAPVGDTPGTIIALPTGTPLFAHKGDVSAIAATSSQYGLTVTRDDGSGWVLGTITAWVKKP